MIVKAWLVSPFGKVTCPMLVFDDGLSSKVTVMLGKHDEHDVLSAMLDAIVADAAAEGITIEVTHGISGIAATDPHWDGKPTFLCGSCTKVHDIHELVAENLFKRRKLARRSA